MKAPPISLSQLDLGGWLSCSHQRIQGLRDGQVEWYSEPKVPVYPFGICCLQKNVSFKLHCFTELWEMLLYHINNWANLSWKIKLVAIVHIQLSPSCLGSGWGCGSHGWYCQHAYPFVCHLSIRPSNHPSIHPSIHPFFLPSIQSSSCSLIHLHIHSSFYPLIFLSIHLSSIHPIIFTSMHQSQTSIHPPIPPPIQFWSIQPSKHLSIHLSIYPPSIQSPPGLGFFLRHLSSLGCNELSQFLCSVQSPFLSHNFISGSGRVHNVQASKHPRQFKMSVSQPVSALRFPPGISLLTAPVTHRLWTGAGLGLLTCFSTGTGSRAVTCLSDTPSLPSPGPRPSCLGARRWGEGARNSVVGTCSCSPALARSHHPCSLMPLQQWRPLVTVLGQQSASAGPLLCWAPSSSPWLQALLQGSPQSQPDPPRLSSPASLYPHRPPPCSVPWEAGSHASQFPAGSARGRHKWVTRAGNSLVV